MGIIQLVEERGRVPHNDFFDLWRQLVPGSRAKRDFVDELPCRTFVVASCDSAADRLQTLALLGQHRLTVSVIGKQTPQRWLVAGQGPKQFRPTTGQPQCDVSAPRT